MRVDRSCQTPVIAAYLARREALVRFFAARLGSPSAAEDLVQEIYIKLAALPPHEPVQNAPAFVYRLGFNLMLDRLKQERRAAGRDTAWVDASSQKLGTETVADEPSPEGALDARRRLAAIVEAMETLPPQTRRAFRLHKFDGLTHAQTAATMGISRSAVEKHVSAALGRLLARLGS